MWYILMVRDRILRYDVGPAAEAVMPGAWAGRLPVVAAGQFSMPRELGPRAAVWADGLGGRPA